MTATKFFMVGQRPVVQERLANGGMDVRAYDWNSGALVRALDLVPRLMMRKDGVEEVSQDVFEATVAQLSKQRGYPQI